MCCTLLCIQSVTIPGQRSELFRPVVVCFRHLLTVHISPSMWLKKASEIIISKGTTDIEKWVWPPFITALALCMDFNFRVLLEAVAFFVLHCEQLKTSDIFQSAYSGIVASLQSTKVPPEVLHCVTGEFECLHAAYALGISVDSWCSGKMKCM